MTYPSIFIDPTDLGAATAIARNLLQDLCLTKKIPIPDAESLPFYPLVLKLVVFPLNSFDF